MTTNKCVVALAGLLMLSACERETDAQPSKEPAAPPAQQPAAASSAAPGIRSPDVPPADATDANVDAATLLAKENALKLREFWAGKTFEEFKAGVYQEPFEGGKYVVSGDIAIADEKHLREFFEQDIQGKTESEGGGRLIVMAGPNGTWNSQRKLALTYCVSSTFGARLKKVADDMLAATSAWQTVADVRFDHVAVQDGNCTPTNNNVVFDVRPTDVQGKYLARAFFPNDSRSARNVLIDESAFRLPSSSNLQLVGILRHEIGHTLGWRHEHIRPESGTCTEDANWKPISRYDRFSVMHYPHCNGGGDWKLLLTETDQSSAACVYGPASRFVIKRDLIAEYECTGATESPVAGTSKTETFTAQTVAQNSKRLYGTFATRAGTTIIVIMTPTAGSPPGDADLYLQVGEPPGLGRDEFACRPYLSTSSEICEVTTRSPPRNKVYLMINGYRAATFDLKVTYLQ